MRLSRETSLTNEQIFADISASELPQPDPSQPPETYIDTLRHTFPDLWQIAIINGVWDLAGIAVLDEHREIISGEEAERLDYSLDNMRLGFQVFGCERLVRAGNLLLQYARGLIATQEIPTELLFIDPLSVPTRPPRFGSEEYDQFNTFIQSTLGLSSEETNAEIMKILDMFRRNVFIYTPSDLLTSYWKIAAALPDAKIPDEIGTLIYELRHQS